MTTLERLALVFAGVVGAGCPGGSSGADATVCDFAVTWGHGLGDEFAPFSDGDPAEITLGFQGFRYVASTVRVGAVDAAAIDVLFQVDVDGHEPYVQSSTYQMPAPDGQGRRDVDYVLVFFNDIPLPELVNRTTRIQTRATAGGCEGYHDVTVTLVDDDNCTELPDGTLECTPDAGP